MTAFMALKAAPRGSKQSGVRGHGIFLFNPFLILAGVLGVAGGAEERLLPRYEGKPLGYWVERFQKSENDVQRKAAARAVSSFGADGAPAVPALIEMLDDHSAEYRSQVSSILMEIGRAGAKPVVPALVRLLKDNKARDRAGVFWVLGEIGPPAAEAVPVLAEALKDEGVRGEALIALGNIGPGARTTAPALVKHLTDRKNRSFALSALLRIKAEGDVAVPSILLAIRDSESFEDDVRAAGGALPVTVLGQSAEGDWRTECLDALAEFGPAAKAATPTLKKYGQAKGFKERFAAARALWLGAKDPAAIPVLGEGILYPERSIVGSAVKILGEIGPQAKAVLPILGDLLKAASGHPHLQRSNVPILTSFCGKKRYGERPDLAMPCPSPYLFGLVSNADRLQLHAVAPVSSFLTSWTVSLGISSRVAASWRPDRIKVFASTPRPPPTSP